MRPDQSSKHPPALAVLAAQWSPAITIFGLLLVLLCTLYPFRFRFEADVLQAILQKFELGGHFSDMAANIILFCPLGFGWAGLSYRHALERPVSPNQVKKSILTIAVFSLVLSTGIEISQVFLQARASTVTDILTNSLGGAMGAYLFHRYGLATLKTAALVSERSKKVLSIPVQYLTAAFVGYMLVAFAIAVFLQTHTLSNWSTFVPIRLGGQLVAQAASWDGTMTNLQIADRAASRAEARKILARQGSSLFQSSHLVADYPLQAGNYQDRSGHSPTMVWRGQSSGLTPENATLKQGQWLETAPATALLQRLRQTSQFTIKLAIAPATLEEQKLRPFLALGDLLDDYNLILVQSNNSLVTYMRTAIRPHSEIPVQGIGDFFTSTRPQQILLAYSAYILRIYSDQTTIEYSTDFTNANSRVILLGLIFAPLGLLLSLIMTQMEGIVARVMLCSAALVPSLLLEGLVIALTHRNLSWGNLLLGFLIMASALLTFNHSKIFARQRNHW